MGMLVATLADPLCALLKLQQTLQLKPAIMVPQPTYFSFLSVAAQTCCFHQCAVAAQGTMLRAWVLYVCVV